MDSQQSSAIGGAVQIMDAPPLYTLPDDYQAKPFLNLVASEPAFAGLRRLLQGLLSTIEVNVEGVVKDVDSEFLHDLRVAVRRSRSSISELKAVIDRSAFVVFVDELRWLGRITGPLRDLDVCLLGMDDVHDAVSADDRDALGPFDHFLEHSRNAQQSIVAAALQSNRMQSFVASWHRFLETDAGSKNVDSTIQAAVDRRIRHAHRRIVKKARRLGPKPPAVLLHRVRIDAKKLRYLIELFRELYDEAVVKALLLDLKQLQTMLGDLNDKAVQRQLLAAFIGDLDEVGEVGEVDQTLLRASGRLEEELASREDDLRSTFSQAFTAFDSDLVHERFAELLSSTRCRND